MIILAGVLGGMALLIAFVYLGIKPRSTEVTLTAWVVFDEPDVYEEIVRSAKRDIGVRITFVKKEIDAYEAELVNALAAGTGPDVLMINNAWLPKHKDKLYPAPVTLISPDTVRNTYPQVVSDDFVADGSVWALPLSIDTLALFYNRDLLDQAGIAFPPRTWEELVEIVPRLTKYDDVGEIQQSAVALGTTQNINRSTDILAALMLQTGTPIVDRTRLTAAFGERGAQASRSYGEESLLFYLQFADPSKSRVYTWNSRQHYSIDSFSEGTLAMMFNYAYQIPLVRSKGPFVNFSIAKFPQPAAATARVDYANYWGYAVARRSKNPQAAWQFVVYLNDPARARTYLAKTGRPPARRELIQQSVGLSTIGVFAQQALTARTWLQPDVQAVETIFQRMVESVRAGEVLPEEAIRRGVSQINLLLNKLQSQ